MPSILGHNYVGGARRAAGPLSLRRRAAAR
ncbi:hypothetical protein, partial [Pseudomonas aeruginosa]